MSTTDKGRRLGKSARCRAKRTRGRVQYLTQLRDSIARCSQSGPRGVNSACGFRTSGQCAQPSTGVPHEMPGTDKSPKLEELARSVDRRRDSNGARERINEHLLKLMAHAATRDEVALAEVTSDISIMVQFSEFTRTEMVKAGAIGSILAVLGERAHSVEVHTHATAALTSLCAGGYPDVVDASPKAVRARVAAEGGIPIVVGLFDNYGARLNTAGTLKKEPPGKLRLFCRAAEAVAVLATEYSSNCEAFLLAGVLEPLIALACSTDTRGAGKAIATSGTALVVATESQRDAMDARAAATLSVLATHPMAQSQFAKEDAIKPLIGLLTLSPNAYCREACALALWNLVLDCLPNKISLCSHGGVEALVGLLMSGPTSGCHFYAGRALVHLGTDHSEGKELCLRRLRSALICPNTLQFRSPAFVSDETLREIQKDAEEVNNGHGLIIHLGSPSRWLNLVACMASMELEPARACIAYELTPQNSSDFDDDDEGIDQVPMTTPSR